MPYECFCDYDPPSFYSVRKVKAARKPRVCEECNYKIPPGEPYRIVTGKWDSSLSIFHTCDLCTELEEWAKISVPCFCGGHGNMHEDIREMVDQARRDVPGLVFEWGRRMVKIKRRNIAAARPVPELAIPEPRDE